MGYALHPPPWPSKSYRTWSPTATLELSLIRVVRASLDVESTPRGPAGVEREEGLLLAAVKAAADDDDDDAMVMILIYLCLDFRWSKFDEDWVER